MKQPILTGSRKERYEIAKILFSDDIASITNDLLKQEARAKKQKQQRAAAAKRRAAEAEAREIEAIKAAAAAREAERLRKVEERRKAREEEKKHKAALRTQYNVEWNVSYSIRFKYERDGVTKYTEWKKRRQDFNQVLTGDVEKQVKNISNEFANKLEQQSAADIKNVKTSITSKTKIEAKTIDKKKIKMKKAVALNLDGEMLQEWDTGNGTCVYDFLIYRYGDMKGCKKICNMERLDELFSTYKVHSGTNAYGVDVYETIECPNPRDDGVCVYQLNNFCDAVGVRMYALDDNERIIHSYEPRSINKNLSPLIFRIMNNHFYAIIDKAKSISMMGKSKNSMEYEKKEKQETTIEEVVIVEPEWTEDVNNVRIASMVKTMMNENTQVFPFTKMRFNESGLVSFSLNNKKYVFEEDNTIKNAQAISELNDKPYNGESTYNILLNMLDELQYNNKSICNPSVHKSLTAEGVKFRTHYGMTGHYTRDDLERMMMNGDAICADIAKCYTACLENAYDNWIQYDLTDEWCQYDGNLRTGLYFVETNDMTLFHGSNIYSNKIIELAAAENISFTITKQLIPQNVLPANYYHNLLQRIDEVCKGDKTLKKSLTNIITGFLGKHQSYQYYPKLTTDIETVWNDFNTVEFHQNETFMMKEGDYYLYGYKVPIQNTEINVPHYIQILDWSNIRLYQMIKKSGGECVFRKTDCAVIIGGSLEYGMNNGDYRMSELPNVCGMMRPVEHRCVDSSIVETNAWKVHPNITDSNQVDDVYSLLKKTKGFLNVSRAGTGKTWNALQIERRFREEYGDNAKVIKLAFTNKACLNMGGTTIHKFLKIDKDGKFNMSWLKSLRKMDILFIIDEISMIGKFLWRRLVELKKYLGNNVYFMMLGDYRQAPPVEETEEPIDYFESSALKYMANYHKIEFVVRQRYDEALWNFAEDVYEREYTDYDKVRIIKNYSAADLIKTTNICYYNNTRKRINKMVNDYVANMTTNKYFLEYEPNDGEIKYKQQNVYLYNGCPIIASVNNKKMDIVNNETYIIKSIDDDMFVAVSQRINDDGELEEHTIECETNDFHNYFLLNYCSTTHKQQGATIDNDIVIFDYELMNRNLQYTAITRVKKLSQVSIVA